MEKALDRIKWVSLMPEVSTLTLALIFRDYFSQIRQEWRFTAHPAHTHNMDLCTWLGVHLGVQHSYSLAGAKPKRHRGKGEGGRLG